MQLQKSTIQIQGHFSSLQERNFKTFNSVYVEIQFDEQNPLHLKNCQLSVTNQPSIVIKYCNFQKEANQVNENQFRLQVPFGSILCIGKKSSTTTLLMIKDKQKQIQRDQDGYELVSDDEQDEEFEEKTNPLYALIKSYVNETVKNQDVNIPTGKQEREGIKIQQKCNILLTVSLLPQGSFEMQSQFQSSSQLYKYLSDEMQKFQQTINQSSKNTWTNNLAHTEAMHYGSDYLQNRNLDGDQDGDAQYQEEDYEEDDELDEEQNHQMQEEQHYPHQHQ